MTVTRYLVTGAGGFSGSGLVAYLAQRYASEVAAGRVEVVATDVRLPPADSPARLPGVTYALVDVTDGEAVRRAVAGVTTVFHVGALVPYNLAAAVSAGDLERVNVGGTRTLLAAAAAAGVSNFLFASSTGVVFQGRDLAGVDESTPVPRSDWNDAYSASKAAAEVAVLAASSTAAGGMATLALRPNGIWGPGEAHHIPKALYAAQLGGAGALVGPDALTDFTHRDNLVAAFAAGLACLNNPARRPAVAGKAYYVTDGWPVHTQEFFSPLLSSLGYRAPFSSAFISRAVLAACGEPATEHRVEPGMFAWLCEQQAAADAVAARSSGAAVIMTAAPTPSSSRRRRPSTTTTPTRRGATTRSGEAAAAAEAVAEVAALTAMTAAVPVGDTGERVLVTLRATGGLPGWVMYPVAVACQVAAAVVRPFASIEPFLTVADVRKVVHHNYFVSAAAARELGYAPVRTPTSGMVELIAHYRAAGYNGHVARIPLAMWLAVIFGLALNAAVGYDVGGFVSGAVTAAVSALPVLGSVVIASARALSTAYTAVGLAGLSGLVAAVAGLPPPAAPPAPDTLPLALDVHLYAVRAVFWAAVLIHGVEAAWAFDYAMRRRMAALAWAAQTLVLGFGSARELVAAAGGDASVVVRRALAGFLAAIPVALLLDAAYRGVGWQYI